MVELRVKRGWTYGAGSSFRAGSRPHSWRVGFSPKNADTPPAIKEALNLVRDLKKTGITDAQFNASKQSLVNSSGFSFNTPQKRLENKLIEVLYGLPDGYYRDYAKRLSALTLPEVNQTIESFVDPDHMMIGIVGTASISKDAIANELGVPPASIEVQSYQKE
jgi:zinc protease